MSEGDSAAELLVGREILGTYRLEEVLGRGGMAVVYRGRHVLTDQDVAIKVLPPELAENTELKARFIEEARTLARLEHPNIVALHNFLEERGHLYLVMQFAEGETYDALIEREGRMGYAEVVALGIETLKALEYAHAQSVIHRDIKPSNIVIRGDGAVKVMDFGIAKIVGSSKLTQTGQTMGTVRYMSPEQVRGKNIDHRTDLYSLAVTLYEAVVGKTPFDGDTHFEIMKKHLSEPPTPPGDFVAIPEPLNRALLKGMAKTHEQRYANAAQFREALERVPIDRSKVRITSSVPMRTAADGDATAYDLPRPRRSGRLQLGIAAVVLLLSIGGGLWAMLSESKPATPPQNKTTTTKTKTAKPPALKIPWPEPHALTKTLKFKVDKRYPKLQLRVQSIGVADADKLSAVYSKARRQYVAFVRQEGVVAKIPIGPLNLALVPQALLNTKKHWPGWRPNISYPTRYVAKDATLYVRNSQGYQQTDLIYGLGLHFCTYVAGLSNARCLELAEGFERYLRSKQ